MTATTVHFLSKYFKHLCEADAEEVERRVADAAKVQGIATNLVTAARRKREEKGAMSEDERAAYRLFQIAYSDWVEERIGGPEAVAEKREAYRRNLGHDH